MKEHLENELIYTFIMELSRAQTLGLLPATHGFIWKNRTKPEQMFWNQGRSNPGPGCMNTHWFPFFSQRKLYVSLLFSPSPLWKPWKGSCLRLGGKPNCFCFTVQPGCWRQAALKSLVFSPQNPNILRQLSSCPHSLGSIKHTLWGLWGILAPGSKHPICSFT